MFLYYVLVTLLLLCAGPFLLISAKKRAGIWQKLGFIPSATAAKLSELKNTVWFHTVSVGEFNAAWPLIQEFKKQNPGYSIIISTATKAAQKLVTERASNIATLIYFPLDLPFAVKSWLNAVKPQLVVITETEIWPGFTHECQKRNIPVVVVNGRISLKSAANYNRFKFFFGPVLRRLTTIVAQSDSESNRYQQIGGNDLPIVVSGNLKYDNVNPVPPAQQENLRKQIKIDPTDLVVVAGSTHEGEETAMIDFLKTSLNKKIKLIIAPRHPERWDHVASLINSSGYQVRRYSLNESFTGENDIYLLDTIGKLFEYYSLATVAFVGGTLVPVGGHNLVEPYAYKTAVVCGSHLFKTSDVANALSSIDALTIVSDNAQLHQQLNTLLSNQEIRTHKGNAGYIWLSQSSGALSKTLNVLNRIIRSTTSKISLAGSAK